MLKDQQVSQKMPAWQRQGYSSHEDYLYHRQNRDGTNSGRYRPRNNAGNLDQVKCVPAAEMKVLDRLFAALERTVKREQDYSKDAGESFLYDVGQRLTIIMAGKPYKVEIIQRWEIYGRLRYRLRFLAEQTALMVTQQQIKRLVAVPAQPREHRLQGAIFTSDEAFEAAKRRLARNWARQMSKYQRGEPVLFGTMRAYSKEDELLSYEALDLVVSPAIAAPTTVAEVA